MDTHIIEKNDRVSVIIPVYNVSSYLKKCIESILNQTYQNLEIILIDDGSEDESGKICDLYAEKDGRIVVIHKKNGGLSDARNVGIGISTGKYITFVDSDDWVQSGYIEHLLAILKKEDADISITRETKVYDKGIENEEQVFDINNTYIYTPEEAMINMFYRKGIPVYAWGKLYKRKVFKRIVFPVGELFEDLSTIYLLFNEANKIVLNPIRDYCYLQREKSIINSGYSSKKLIQINTTEKIIKFASTYYPEVVDAAISKCFITALNLYRNIPHKKCYLKDRKYTKNIIKKYRGKVLKDKNNKRLTRILALISFVNIDLFYYFGYMYQYLLQKGIIKLKTPI